jgi:hypothetical protein
MLFKVAILIGFFQICWYGILPANLVYGPKKQSPAQEKKKNISEQPITLFFRYSIPHKAVEQANNWILSYTTFAFLL